MHILNKIKVLLLKHKKRFNIKLKFINLGLLVCTCVNMFQHSAKLTYLYTVYTSLVFIIKVQLEIK